MARPWTVSRINDSLDELYTKQIEGQIDPKTADALNTTLKNVVMLNVVIPMSALKLYLQARIKKVQIPKALRAALPVKLDEDEEEEDKGKQKQDDKKAA